MRHWYSKLTTINAIYKLLVTVIKQINGLISQVFIECWSVIRRLLRKSYGCSLYGKGWPGSVIPLVQIIVWFWHFNPILRWLRLLILILHLGRNSLIFFELIHIIGIELLQSTHLCYVSSFIGYILQANLRASNESEYEVCSLSREYSFA